MSTTTIRFLLARILFSLNVEDLFVVRSRVELISSGSALRPILAMSTVDHPSLKTRASQHLASLFRLPRN